jgi:Pretoxin HINT domain
MNGLGSSTPGEDRRAFNSSNLRVPRFRYSLTRVALVISVLVAAVLMCAFPASATVESSPPVYVYDGLNKSENVRFDGSCLPLAVNRARPKSGCLRVSAIRYPTSDVIAQSIRAPRLTLQRFQSTSERYGDIRDGMKPSVFVYDASRLLRVSRDGMATESAPGVSGACSFEGATRVLMADGTTKRIEDVRVGDSVLAQDPETGEKSARKVTHLWVHDDEYVRLEIDGATVLTTANHPFWDDTDKRWERADELGVGDMVLTADGRRVRVGHMQSAAGHGAAYNLTVEGLHTYHVLVGHDAVLVHNVCPVVELAENVTQPKLDHIFAPKHNLGPLVTQFGSEEAVVSQMLNGVRGSVPASGTFVSTIQVGGQTVVVRGAVVNGVIRIGTAFTP